jgi:hypothetical protein
MLFYRAVLPLSRQTLTFVSDLIRGHRRQLGSVWRKLDPGQQALSVLVYPRKGEPFAQVGAGFGISTATCWRVCQRNRRAARCAVAQAPGGVAEGQREKIAYVIIDGTLIPIDRIAADRPFYSGKHKRAVCHDRTLVQQGASRDSSLLPITRGSKPRLRGSACACDITLAVHSAFWSSTQARDSRL